MDLQSLKQKAQELKKTAMEKSQDFVDFSAGKLADSKMTLKSVKELEQFVESSKKTEFTDSKTGEKKEFSHKVIVIFADTKSDFFKELLYKVVVLEAKSFSQNMKLRLADIAMKDLDKKKYKLENEPTLLVFENTALQKVISGEEKLQKVVKSPTLDINKTIDEL